MIGSRIARIEGESGLPVQVITRDELLDGGVEIMQDLLDRVSANQSFGAFSEAKGEGNTIVGFTAASLHGLGSQRTLVLMERRGTPMSGAAVEGRVWQPYAELAERACHRSSRAHLGA